ncbi:MAG TPA: sarcosine oxidase subunit gamma family protein [Stellaceae bacterium]|nr:sarcosine oxidase subunit gamma family protein [Stellaceae bacterium]
MADLPWSSPAVRLDAPRPMRQIGLRLHPPFPAYLAGIPLPLTPNRVAAAGTVRVLWLGPNEWLVVAEGEAPDLLPRLERAAAGRRAAINDLSSSRVVIGIGGDRARDLLAAGCGLDLHPRVFGPGHCAQTVLARVPVILDQVDTSPHYHVLVRRSYARWLADWLIDAAEGLG